MSTWEERMSQRAKKRERLRRVEERAARGPDPHQNHHTHLNGTTLECSCGKFGGVTCVAFDEEFIADLAAGRIRCEVCGKPDVTVMDRTSGLLDHYD